MADVFANPLMIEGLRNEFADAYAQVANSQSHRLVGEIMDLSLTHDNYYGWMGYMEAPPHPEQWVKGDSIPEAAMSSKQFKFQIWDWGRRVNWHRNDRDDEKTGTLVDMARGAGRNFGLIPERMAFDLLTASTDFLPVVPNAADGAAMYATTAGGANRFGVSNGNLLTGNGITTTADVLTDYYAGIEQIGLFQDGQGQPLYPADVTQSDTLVLHALADTKIFEEAFKQSRQAALGPDNTSDAVTSVAVTNIILDTGRTVTLWGSSRLATGDWYLFLRNPPKKPLGYVTRQALEEHNSMMNSTPLGETQATKKEWIQWDARMGGLIGLPFATVKINNS